MLGSVALAYSSTLLSRSLHSEMIGRVLRCSMEFFDVTPRGRILNRFAVDLDFLDCRYFMSVKISAQSALLTVAKVAVVGSQSWAALGLSLFAGIGLFFSLVSSPAFEIAQELRAVS